nr:hypothetical protein GCM10020093_098460 [Planobispora longispora]
MWIRLVNGSGVADDPFRATNAVDCALATLATWYGAPTAAAPRYPEYDRIGKPLLTGETGGPARAERWLGHRLQHIGQGRHAYTLVAQRLLAGGHGSAALLVTRWPSGGSHAWNAVNSGGEVIWIDAQRGHMAVEPPYESVTGIFAVIIDREGAGCETRAGEGRGGGILQRRPPSTPPWRSESTPSRRATSPGPGTSSPTTPPRCPTPSAPRAS